MPRRQVVRITNNREDGVTVVFSNGARVRVPPANFDTGDDESIEDRSRPDLGVYFRRVQDSLGINRIQVKVTALSVLDGWGETDGWYETILAAAGRKLSAAFKSAVASVRGLFGRA